MKIAILGTRGLPARYGGFETLAYHLSGGLSERGHHVVVYGRTGHGQPARREIAPGLLAQRVPALPMRTLETLSAGISAAIHASIRLRPDVALVCNPANIWAALAVRSMGIPVVLHLDGLEHQRLKWNSLGAALHRRSMTRAAHSDVSLVTDSHAIASWYQDHLHTSPLVISYGVDLASPDNDYLDRLGLVAKEFDLIVARWEPENQVALMVRAHHRSKTERALIVVGEPEQGRYRDEVLAEIAAHPQARSVGKIWNPQQLAALYDGAMLYLHGHSVGGTNPTLLSGAASPAEVIAHDNAFNSEVLAGAGWMWRDEEELTALLSRAPWKRKSKVGDRRDLISERYQWTRVIEQYEGLFEAVKRR